jgi:large subunit ribosomal protein L9
MKVILQQEVKKVGKKGDILEVSEGYARNFLLPKGYAVAATSTNLNAVNQQKKSEERKQQQAVDEATLMAAQLSKIEVSIAVKIGEGGKLFGSVTGKDIAEALKQDHNIDMDKRKIEVKEGIKGLGDYEAVIKVHPEITSKIKVHIIAG